MKTSAHIESKINLEQWIYRESLNNSTYTYLMYTVLAAPTRLLSWLTLEYPNVEALSIWACAWCQNRMCYMHAWCCLICRRRRRRRNLSSSSSAASWVFWCLLSLARGLSPIGRLTVNGFQSRRFRVKARCFYESYVCRCAKLGITRKW